MKFFIKPLVAFLLALMIVLGSTCISARNGLIGERDQVCEELGTSILAFATDKKLPELTSLAKAALSHYDEPDREELDSLIVSYSASASGENTAETKAVDHAVKDYRKFCQAADRFPGVVFNGLFDIF